MRHKIKTPSELKPVQAGKKIKISVTIDEVCAKYLEEQSAEHNVGLSVLVNEAIKLYIEYSNDKK